MTGTQEQRNLLRKTYLLIGDGKLSRHLDYYFKSQNIFLKNWSRKNNTAQEFQDFLQKSDCVLLAIKDSEIQNFINEHNVTHPLLVHFSGALLIPGTVALHPLMTFSDTLYSIDFYKKIPFIGVQGEDSLTDIFPSLENPYFEIKKEDKPLYHSLCVMANNFTTLLWQKVFQDFSSKLSLPKEVLTPYLEATFENIKNNPETALTGPIARNDLVTILKNISSLENDAFQNVYKSFVTTKIPDFTHGEENDNI